MAALLKFKSFQIYKEKRLGNGSFSEVFEARCDSLPCAAKVLHNSLLDSQDPDSARIAQHIQDECRIMKALHHPCIIHYLGRVVDPDTGLLVLMMEIATGNLTMLLQHHQGPLSPQLQVELNHDIVLAIVYLHHNHIIHRDLSSDNILIIAGARAKVGDFGVAMRLEGAEGTQNLIPVPGTMVYMPPEAMIHSNYGDPAVSYGNSNYGDPVVSYGFKLDVFSLGVLNVQICTRKYPKPHQPLRKVKLENMGEERAWMVWEKVPELVRRQSHIQLIDSANPMLPLALDCLRDQEHHRPSAHEIGKRIENMRIRGKLSKETHKDDLTDSTQLHCLKACKDSS